MSNFLHELKEGLLISFKAIRANKIRSVLTTLGIVIGVAAVVLMSNAIQGIDASFRQGVSSMGSDNLYIDKWAWFNNDIPWWELRNRRNLDMDDFKKYKDMARLPVAVAPTVWNTQTIKAEDKTLEYAMITGTNQDYIKTTNLEFESGRFFTELESKGARQVAVIGSEVAKNLFPNGNALGSEINIKGRDVRVVGVLKEQGSYIMGNFNPDNQTFVPIGFIFKNLASQRFRSVTINVRAGSSEAVEQVKEEAIGIMRKVRGLKYDERDDFSINQQEGLLNEINSTVGVIQIGGFLITGLSLFVGAIGIMNIMFVSVKERTKEIGIRKAIGAKRRTILGQFISEAAIICLIGGMMGLLVAIIGTMAIQQSDFPISLEVNSAILAISISLITGVLSGFAPAFTASRMDPVEALRYE